MGKKKRYSVLIIPLLVLFFGMAPVNANIFVQCPGDTDGDGISDDPNIVCTHFSAGDGFVRYANTTLDRNNDGVIDAADKDAYIFSFGRVAPGLPVGEVVAEQTLKQRTPGPLVVLKQDQDLYLTLTNVGMIMRPDLFDTHSLHWHGFANAAVVFDGVPENSLSPVMAASLTYYYKAAVPGTYFYHCHVEATEHMQMGMIGNIWIEPSQDGTPLGGFTKFAYNDGDGSTGYDVVYPIQFFGIDSAFHDAHLAVQPLPFAAMFDDYAMINGRSYPDTINNDDIQNLNGFAAQPASDTFVAQLGTEFTMDYTGIAATSGQSVLLRISNVSTTHQYDIATTLGVPMRVVGRDAALLRGPDGDDTSWQATILRVAPGQHYDVILNTTGVLPGTYFLYTTNLSVLSNGLEERGGLMTEIKIN